MRFGDLRKLRAHIKGPRATIMQSRGALHCDFGSIEQFFVVQAEKKKSRGGTAEKKPQHSERQTRFFRLFVFFTVDLSHIMGDEEEEGGAKVRSGTWDGGRCCWACWAVGTVGP